MEIFIGKTISNLFRFEAKGGASAKQQDAQRLKMANGIIKNRKKPDKNGVLKRNLEKLVKTCKENGLSLDEVIEIVNATF